MKNVLILSNGAPNYHYFFNHLARLLSKDEANVAFAVDSELSRDNNALDELNLNVYEFSSYFRQHETNIYTLQRYNKYNLNFMLLSDFERAEIYGVWGEKDKGYLSRLLSALCSFYEMIIEKENIDYILYENVSNTFSHVAWAVATEHGKKYLGIGGSRIPGRFSISSNPLDDSRAKTFSKLIETNSIEVPEEVKKWSAEYLENIDTVVPDYMKINGLDNINLITRYFNPNKINTLKRIFKHVNDDGYHSFQSGNPVKTYFNLFKRNVKRKLKIKKLKHYYDDSSLDESFLLYPMHFHPESSTSILAGNFLNEYEVIKNISFNLPQGVFLYVKDHISAWGYPSLDFYNKLKKLPNVKILAPTEQTKLLIKSSLGVVTLTSTVGYEALLLGKKVFLYGNVFYEYHKNVVKVESPEKLFNIFNENLKPFNNDIEYAKNFVAACYLATYPGTMNLMLTGRAAEVKAEEIYLSVIKEIVFSDIDAVENEKIWL
ncbi:capsular polysaccharide export protein, LipB/KpsS family [Pantoea trifolii]|uniref:Capsule polysaccharide biosynthesis protein n=1 Tax=Pantoea trifolii TaxID=2968030 RepID=A0ABT1VL92_9GAMM|nr:MULTISPECIES: hypothetical protein [unclassified Pantoea]MCQ8228298.1 hypothetical protein [Pantoea sp. MMK2]MCQ8236471.1 hypothetical protein [Pantoea sp. MMK3]